MASVRDLLVRITGDGADLEKELNSSIRNLDAVGRRAERLGRDLSLKFTAPLVAAGAAATKLATDFDSEMNKIVTLVGVAEEQVNEWRGALLELGPAVGRSPRELARALFVITSAGERGANALNILERAAKASATGLGETTEIARTVTAAMQAYSDAGLTAERATDILVATVREGNLEASSLAGSLGRVLGVAADVGVSFDEVGGFVATFTRLGVSAEEAVVALRGALNVVQKPTQGARDALESMGMSLDGLRVSIVERGLARTLVELVQTARETGTEISAIIPNVRALSGVLGTAGVQAEAFEEIVQNVADSTGILDDAFARIEHEPAQTFAQLRASAEALAISMGDALAPTLNELLRTLLPLLRVLREIDASTIESAAKFAALVATIGPLIFAAGSAARTVATLGRVLLGARAAVVALGTGLLPAAAVMVGLGLLVKNLISTRLEAIRAGIALAELRAEIMAMGEQERIELGITTALERIETEQALREAREELARLEEEAGSTNFGGALAGGAAATGTPEMREQRQEIRELEDSLESLTQRMDVLNEARARSEQSQRRLAEEEEEAKARAEEMIRRFQELGGSAEEAGGKIRAPAEVLADLEERLRIAEDLGELSGAFDGNRLAVTAYQSALQELLEGGLDPTDERVRQVAEGLEEMRGQVEGQAQILAQMNDQLAAAVRLGEVAADEFDAQAMSVAAYETALQELLDLGLDPMDPAVQEVLSALRAMRLEVQESAEDAEKLGRAQSLVSSLLASARTPAEEYALAIQMINLALKAEKISQEEAAIAREEARRQMEELADEAARTGQSWEDQFASAVVSATGQVSLSFKAMAEDILQQIARVIARLLVMRAMMALLAPFAGGAGVGGALFSAFSAPFAGGRQHGGPVSPGRTFLVGEAGPELFRPSSAGTIVPNNALAGGQNGPSAQEILSSLGPVPVASPEVAAVHDWYRRLLGRALPDARERGVDF